MLPEDFRSSWVSDYKNIEADISKMEDFADKVAAEVRHNYGPHAESLYEDMTAEIPSPYAAFAELSEFLVAHNKIEQDTATLVHDYQNATNGFASAADTISQKYRNADAFAAARVSDVNNALQEAYSQQPTTNPAPPAENTVPDVPSTTEVH